MTKLNLYGVMTNHVEFATAASAGLLTMTLDMWNAGVRNNFKVMLDNRGSRSLD